MMELGGVFKATPQEQLELITDQAVDVIQKDDLLKKLEKSYQNKKPLRLKLGADPSRPDLHLGHTVVLNKLRTMQELGHEVDFLIGDFTAMIGDPTGRNETRPVLSAEKIQENSKSYQEQIFKILDPEKTRVVYNSHWLGKLTPVDFIKLTAQSTVARMLERDDFTKRYREGVAISIHEFLYPLCQGYDSVHLKSDMEFGGTDQKFNLLMGRDLQRSYGIPEQVILTMPILEGLDGVQKMSKSLDNYIGVNDSPKDIFGKTMKITDQLMIRYYQLLTNISGLELGQLSRDIQSGAQHPKDVKVNLAKILVSRFYGNAAATAAHEEFERVFKSKGEPDAVPEFQMAAGADLALTHLLVQTGLTASVSEAKRAIQGRAVEIDGVKVEDEQLKISMSKGSKILLKNGKRKFARVEVI
jgi:tyrosyl-tRNA synthetase